MLGAAKCSGPGGQGESNKVVELCVRVDDALDERYGRYVIVRTADLGTLVACSVRRANRPKQPKQVAVLPLGSTKKKLP